MTGHRGARHQRADGAQELSFTVVFGDVFQIRDVSGSLTIDRASGGPYRVVPFDPVPRLAMTREQALSRPGQLLQADRETVPFHGRTGFMAELGAWRDAGDPVGVRLVHGPGGSGKSRLARQWADRCRSDGWTIWSTQRTLSGQASAGIAAAEGDLRISREDAGLLVVIDYADRWLVDHLIDLVRKLVSLNTSVGVPVRVLCLARSAAGWWVPISQRLDSEEQVDAEATFLTPLDRETNRQALFTEATEQFASALGLPDDHKASFVVPPGLSRDQGFSTVLALHMAALTAVDAQRRGQDPPRRPAAISRYLLEREITYWQQLYEPTDGSMIGRIRTRPATMGQATYVAALAQPRTLPIAIQALRAAGVDETLGSAGTLTELIDDHALIYPPRAGAVLEPVHPDLLAEDFIALVTPPVEQADETLDSAGSPGDGLSIAASLASWARDVVLVEGLLSDGPADRPWLASTITVLVEISHRWPHVAVGYLFPLLRRNPELVFGEAAATFTRITAIQGVDEQLIEVLEILDAHLPDGRHLDLAVGAAAIAERLFSHRLRLAADDARRAEIWGTLGYRLAEADRYQEALRATRRAVDLRRTLAASDPVYRAELAMSLSNQGLMLREVGRLEESIAAAEEAVALRREIVAALPDKEFGDDLATSLNNMSTVLSDLARWEEALVAAQEATEIFRRLSDAHPGLVEDDLALALNTLAGQLWRFGRHRDALAASAEAVEINRRLTEAAPRVHLDRLATALSNFSHHLSDAGRMEEALESATEATAIRRDLAAQRPDVFEPALAAALDGLGLRLGDVGRHGEAVVALQESVALHRIHAAERPKLFTGALAMTLNNLSIEMGDVGRDADSLAFAAEAVRLYRQLSARQPDVFDADLAMALSTYGTSLHEMNQPHDALQATVEAAGLYRRLNGLHPGAFDAQVALAETNLSNRFAELGRTSEAVAAATDSVEIARRLAAAAPETYRGQLAASLTNLGNRLSQFGRPYEALDISREAADLYRQLSLELPRVHRPDLANALNNLSTRMLSLGLSSEALAAAEEGVAIRRELAAAEPEIYTSDLAASLVNLGNDLGAAGRPDEALEAADEAARLFRRLAAGKPGTYRAPLSMALNNMAIRLSHLGRHQAALEVTEEALALRRVLASSDPDRFAPELAMSLTNLGAHLAELDLSGRGRREEALDALQEAATLYESLARARPEQFTSKLARAHYNLGVILREMERPAEAVAATARAIDLYRRLAATHPRLFMSHLVDALADTSVALADGDQLDAAVKALTEAADLHARHAGLEPDELDERLAGLLQAKADLLRRLSRGSEAAELEKIASGPVAGGTAE